MDSSSIVGAIDALRRPGDPTQSTFSARYSAAACDEGQYIDAVVAHTGASAHMVWLKETDLHDDIDRFIWHQDEPVAGTSQFAQWKVMELAKQADVTVLLDGQGADEVIGGYPSLTFGYWYAELFASRKFGRLISDMAAFRRTHGAMGAGLRYFGGGLMPPRMREHWRMRFLGTAGLVPGPSHLARSLDSREPGRRRADQTLKRALYEALTVTSLPSLLRYGDRSSMAFSREARLPFLDHRLVEFVFALPSDRFVSGALTKSIQRDAMHGLVPERVLQRTDKIGFATPQRDWLTGLNRKWIEDVLQASKRRGLLNSQRTDGEWARLQHGASNSGTVWRIVNLELWCQRFIDAC